ncbi:Aste57867_20877 [Aphanomyces stellatus]|uniref:Aste57867_20877 protein n=1 Tax=Aphanomyces stellatus TaxID=120398 RepID=A0A485LG27_9STRA|nr:hypothetical protein As57867_020809 [Aphanomyces stellatus]VFT97554.1 Aste57867_20877 [Aphanomyces stellatus]
MVGWQVVPSPSARSSRRLSSAGAGAAALRSSGDADDAKRPSESDRHASDTTLKRVLTNILPGILVFLVTLTFMLLSLVTLLLLVSQGMFDRLVVSINTQTMTQYWAPYGQDCLLDQDGFLPNTCNNNELTVAPAAAFSAIGTILAQQWAAEMTEAGGTLKVTTCIIGGTSAVGWANLQFIAGYDYFPSCLPTAPQDVAGMAMLETTIRDNHVDGLYFLTLYADLDPSMTVYAYKNTDGTTQNLIQNPQRTLITAEGEIEEDDLGQDYIIYSQPLGSRYLVTGLCITEIEELSQIIVQNQLTGWSRGKHSGYPIVPGWSCGHRVSNAGELIVLQSIFAILSLGLFAGDIFVTFEGFRGIFTGEHVMTYTIISGLERRKALLVCVVLNSLPSLLYLDVSRIYYFTSHGFEIWVISAIMMASFFSFGLLLVISVLDTLPLRCGNKCIGFSAPLYLFASILAIVASCCNNTVYQNAYNKFYAADPYLGLWINNATWPSGSYVADGTPVVLTYLVKAIVYPIGISFASSVAFTALCNLVFYKRLFVDTSWCHANSFLSQIKLPNFITSLPLGPSHAIRLGHEMYCKPSTLAVMGYATVVDNETTNKKHATHAPCSVVSIYALVSAMFVPGWCEAIGTMEQNKFKPSPATCTLHAEKKYIHTRGVCVV